MHLNEKQKEFLSKLSKEDKEVLISIIKNTDVDGDYTGMDSDGGSFWQESVSETLNSLCFQIERFDPTDIHS